MYGIMIYNSTLSYQSSQSEISVYDDTVCKPNSS